LPLWVITDVDTEFDSLRFNLPFAGVNNPGLESGVSTLLDLFNKYEINATFHVQEQRDPEQSVSEKYPKVLEQIEQLGYEIGLHVHTRSISYQERKLEISVARSNLIELGYKPISFRAGWYFTTTTTVKILDQLGFMFDCSPVKNTCIGPMRWYNIPDSPYHPDSNNITNIGSMRLLIIPVSNYRLGINWQRGNSWELDLNLGGVELLTKMSEEMTEPIIIYLTTHSWKAVHPSGKPNHWTIQRFKKIFSYLSQYQYVSYDVKTAGDKWIEKGYSPYFLSLPDLLGNKLSILSPQRHLTLCKFVLSRFKALQYNIFGSF